MASAAPRRHLRIGDVVVAEVQRLLARPVVASDTDRLCGSADWRRMVLHMEMKDMNNGENLPVYNVLDGLLKGSLERLKTMRKIMNEDCNQVPPNIIFSTIMMDGYFKNGDVIGAANLWSGISQQNNRIDVIAY
ncbi:hypothetical protein MLD38_011883 [Melastoma candidum]|uniref:Uncharacterized protein n=1 Tax=Melastoma candidum TaxID=119954 RepID=A0ACB9R532_9MYRT|nr:hypothetical protein MLD38_011883 [Melastoma candidum]